MISGSVVKRFTNSVVSIDRAKVRGSGVEAVTTMRDVAERAGVSIATVSFVVNGTKPVSPDTRDRIEMAMAELGFRRNPLARALASRRSRMLAMAYPELQHRLGNTPMTFVTGAATAARERDHHLVLWPVDSDDTALGDLVKQGLVDGIVLMEVLLDDPRVTNLSSTATPFSMIGRTAEPDGLPYVDIDFQTTLDAALDHLQRLGHREVALMTEKPAAEIFRGYGAKVRAEAAYRTLCADRGVEPVVREASPAAAAGRAAARELLAQRPHTTAVMVMNESAAVGVVSGLVRAGYHVPDDVSVLSIGTSSDMGALSDPVLSIMRAPGAQLGQLAVDVLIDQLEGEPVPQPRLLPCELVPGESTAPARTSP